MKDRRNLEISRRQFCIGVGALIASPAFRSKQEAAQIDIAKIDRARILKAADHYVREEPVTITATRSSRSAGGPHDYFSEGDYWWPDPKNPNGPYIQRDGFSNPDNFVGHRNALIRLSVQMPALTAAWLLTRNRQYAEHAAKHLRAWFIDPATLMNPNLQYAQAIHRRFTGRGIGIIDTLHLVEVVRAASVLQASRALAPGEYDKVQQWFSSYVKWMTTSRNGQEEREAKNNHGTCWVVQVAEFARFVGDVQLMATCRERFKTVLVPNQIAADGSFPQEMRRTKPYGYSLFNLDAMAMACQILSATNDNLWQFQLSDGRGIRKAMEFMVPYIRNKAAWPLRPDVEYFQYWPVRQPSLLFAGLAFSRPDYIDLWRKLDPDPSVPEIIRNYPFRQPILWIG